MNREESARRIVKDLKELAALTSDERGAQRLSWTPAWQAAAAWFCRRMEEAGAEVTMDAVGNVWAKFAGKKEESIVVGSHIDSVPDGGCHREYITFTGQQSHCGSPVSLRRDAFLAAAEATVDFRRIALAHEAYCTVGHVDVYPNVVTISPGQCRLSLDIRCIQGPVLQEMIDEAHRACAQRAADNGVSVAHDVIWHKEPVLFDAKLQKLCWQAVFDETGRHEVMYSAPLHDAVEMVKVVPSIMMFVMSDPGISHCREEDTPEPALLEGICAFLRLIENALKS